MKSFALPHYFALFWARMFALGSLFFLLLAGFMVLTGVPVWSSRIYMLLLMGFVNFYIISVQHGAIPFPRNFGGWHKRAATYSFISMFLGVLLSVFFRGGFLIYGLGFILYLLFQHRFLILYRWRSRKWQFDILFVLFAVSASFWGVLFVFPSSYFSSVHSLFLGFQLNMFLACAYFMLPRFSRQVRERLTGGLFLGFIVWILLNGAVLLNFTAFFLRVHFPVLGRWFVDVEVIAFSTVLLQIAAWMLIIALFLYLLNIGGFIKNALKVASISHISSIIYFIAGAYMSTLVSSGNYAFKPFHEKFMMAGMMLMATSMGYHWFMLNFSLPGARYSGMYILSILFLLLMPFFSYFLVPFSFLFVLWFLMEIKRNSRMLIGDAKNNLREITSIF